MVQPHIGIYHVADVIGHRRGQGGHSPHNYIYRLRLKGFGPEADLEHRAHQVPQCQELIAAYCAQHQLKIITPPPCNKQKHPASKNGNPPGSDAATKDGNPPHSDAAPKDGNPLGSDAAPEDGNPLGSDVAPEDGSPLGSDAAPEDDNPLGSDAAPEDGSLLESEHAIRKRKSRSCSNKEKNNPKRRK